LLTLRALAFDLDGTLVDTAPDIAAALNRALAGAGLPPVAAALSRTWIGDGPDVLIARALDHLGERAPPALSQSLRRGFDAATLDAPLQHGRVFDGIDALLECCAATHPLAVVTNKPTALARRVLDAAGLLDRFAAVHGADAPAQRKPAPALLYDAAAALRVTPGALLMVGDSAHDVHAAHAAGCAAAWAAWGYGAWPADAPPGTWRLADPSRLADRLADPLLDPQA
jgi:phosphoglycolate phosphatase